MAQNSVLEGHLKFPSGQGRYLVKEDRKPYKQSGGKHTKKGRGLMPQRGGRLTLHSSQCEKLNEGEM